MTVIFCVRVYNCLFVFVCIFVYAFRRGKSLRPVDIGPGLDSSPFLVLLAETTVTSVLNVICLLTYLISRCHECFGTGIWARHFIFPYHQSFTPKFYNKPLIQLLNSGVKPFLRLKSIWFYTELKL